ncbi:MAG: 5-(carboxyamino)imidazole ribonucleotide mutase [Bradymonadaceae bacterium]|nr:5-(carboxyamino)imidazole ribonucleotide mutase [Lujinxingiaceae bacterium]
MQYDFDAEVDVVGPGERAVVGVIMGSDSDWPVMKKACDILEELQIPFERLVLSAHRTPERALAYAQAAEKRGLKIIIAAAGAAAHLAGVVAATTNLPVIGVPIKSSTLDGLDSLLSMVQMPSGIPVATVSVGSGGAPNAAILAARILALADPALRERHANYRNKLAEDASKKAPWKER